MVKRISIEGIIIDYKNNSYYIDSSAIVNFHKGEFQGIGVEWLDDLKTQLKDMGELRLIERITPYREGVTTKINRSEIARMRAVPIRSLLNQGLMSRIFEDKYITEKQIVPDIGLIEVDLKEI